MEEEPGWLLEAAEFFHDIGDFAKSHSHAERAAGAGKSSDCRIQRKALFIQFLSSLSIANQEATDACVNRLEILAAAEQDPLTKAIADLARGMNWRPESGEGSRDPQDYYKYTVPLFDEVSTAFESSGEVNLAIRARLESARAKI